MRDCFYRTQPTGNTFGFSIHFGLNLVAGRFFNLFRISNKAGRLPCMLITQDLALSYLDMYFYFGLGSFYVVPYKLQSCVYTGSFTVISTSVKYCSREFVVNLAAQMFVD